MRIDGAVRIVFIPRATVQDKWMTTQPQLVVEEKGKDALGNETWSYAPTENMGGNRNLEAYALALMGESLSEHSGFRGELQDARLVRNARAE